MSHESEHATRRNRIDPKLDAAGWTLPRGARPARGPFRTEEEEHLRENLSIDRDDFDLMPVFSDAGGLCVVRRAFGADKLDELLHQLNEAIAA